MKVAHLLRVSSGAYQGEDEVFIANAVGGKTGWRNLARQPVVKGSHPNVALVGTNLAVWGEGWGIEE